MLVDFPEAKKEIQKLINKALQQQVKQRAPAWALGSKKTLFEGDKLSVLRPDGTRDVSELRNVESSFTIPRADVPKTSIMDILDKVTAAAEDMAGQIEKGFIETLTKATDQGANTIPGNPALSPEGVLAGLAAVWVDFDDDDREKPISPTLIAGPAAIENLLKMDNESTPEQKQEYKQKEKQIFDRKYMEYMEDLKSRKLVD